MLLLAESLEYNLVPSEMVIAAILTILLISAAHCRKQNSSVTNLGGDDEQCPPWLYYNDALDQCSCYQSNSRDVQCVEGEGDALLRFGRCMTYEEGSGTFVGLCQYFIIDHFLENVTERHYISLPDNVQELNEFMCKPLNRKGKICQECIDGFGPAVTSVGYQCSNCTSAWYGIPLYLFLEFVPITIFYVVILVFRVSVTSAPMTSYVMYSQLLVFAFTVDIEAISVIRAEINGGIYILLNIVIMLYGIWNLDFFRYIVPPFCVSSQLKIIHIVFLTYISAFYPLCLIAITWACIELHSRNFKPLVWLWKRTHRLFFMMKQGWNPKNTVVDVFATFLLLSYTKLMLQSLATLGYVHIEIANDTNVTVETVSALDPSVDYFGFEHLPFAIIAMLILLFIVLLPALLLALYPIQHFRSLLTKCRLVGQPQAALNLFVEKFYLCYRDGLGGGWDMRGFAALYFFLRATVIATDVIKKIPSPATSWFFNSLIFGVLAMIIAIVRPYKKAYMNNIDALVLFTLSVLSILYTLYLYTLPDDSMFREFFLYMLIFVVSLPQVGFIVYIATMVFQNQWLMRRVPSFHKCCRVKDHEQEIELVETEEVGDEQRDQLPDRLVHPENYDHNAIGLNSNGNVQDNQTEPQPARNDYCSV